MSKIGNKPLPLPQGVTVEIKERTVTVKGPKGVLTFDLPRHISVSVIDNTLNVVRDNESLSSKALHGTYRSLIANAAHGVTSAWEKKIEIVGTGFGVSVKNGEAVFKVGFSHLVIIPKKDGITYVADGPTMLTISGINKELVGQVAHEMRCIKPPDPYKGKGIRYAGEQIKLKPGKKAKTA